MRLRGEPAQGGFELHALVDPASGAGTAALEKIALKGPGVDLGGRVAANLKPPQVRFAFAGPLLDLGQVMGLVPQQSKKKQEGPLLTSAQRKQVSALDVAGTIDIQKVLKGGLVANDFHAKAVLDHGVFVLQEARTRFFGGSVNADGTRVNLAQEDPGWDLKAKLDGVEVGQALQSVSGSAPVTGKMGGVVDLAGAGVDWPKLQKVITGHGTLTLKQGELTSVDLGSIVTGAAAKGLQAVGIGGPASKEGGGGKTEFRDLSASFTVKDGAMTLSKPVTFAAPFGGAQLGGKMGLDGALALKGTATLSKQSTGAASSKLAGTQVPIALAGTLSHPSVNVDAGQAFSGAAKQQGEQIQKEMEKAKAQGRKGVGDLLRKLGK